MAEQARIERLRQMLADSPDDSFLRYGLGLELIRTGSTDEGIEKLRELIRDEPSYVAAYFQMGQALAARGDTAEACDILAKGAQAARQSGDPHAAEEMEAFLASIS